MRWLLEQWSEIRGHAKWAVVGLIWLAVTAAAIALTHGLALWQQLALLALFIVMFGWCVFMSAAAGAFVRRNPLPSPLTIEPPNQEQSSAFSTLDHARLADTRQQLLCLSHFERFAVWQLLLKGGLTGEQFADLVEAYGIPVATRFGQEELTKTFVLVQNKSALLVYDQTSERWTIKPEFKDFTRNMIERMSPIFGI
jgi:hypothetical protein